ncbi:MAG: hypothetical protein AB7D00_08935 [Rhodospirillaceae bacterium]
MNRRDFFTRMNPFRADAPKGGRDAGSERERTDALFRLAMARGIDPATVDPERLPELLGLNTGTLETTGR